MYDPQLANGFAYNWLQGVCGYDYPPKVSFFFFFPKQ